MFVIGHPLMALVNILDSILFLYTMIIIASAILSWVNPDPMNPIVRIIRNLTDPAMRKLQPYVPLVGGIDLTPIAVLLVIHFFRTGILPIVYQFAHGLV